MSIWEGVYSKHKGSKTVPLEPPKSVPEILTDSVHIEPQPTSSASFEEMYYGINKSQAPDAPELQPSNSASFEEIYYGTAKPKAAAKPAQQPASSASFEEMYYGSGKPQAEHPQTIPPSKPQRAQQRPREQAPQPQTPSEKINSRFIPRQPGKLITPYPAVLAKMRNQLSDMWANIMVETKQNLNALLICGATRGEGSTFISFHLAMYLSKEYNMKVIYVDTNLSHIAIPKTQGLPGLYSFVSENKDLSSLIVPSDYPGLFLLPSGAGNIAKNIGGNMLTREPAELLIQFCRNNFDMTIIDGQPITSSAVMIELARLVDMTLLVCRYGYSRHEVCKMATDKLQKFGITSIGAVLNDRRFPVPPKLYRLMG